MCDAVIDRLKLLSQYTPDNDVTPVDLIQEGLCDPVRIFIKKEPHKKSKILAKRYRLISSVSLIDQMIERLLFANQNKLEVENWTAIPSKPGIGLNDVGLEIMYRTVENRAITHDLLETDMSSWDWTVQGWQLEFDVESRIKLCNASRRLATLMRNRVLCLRRSVFALSDGRMFITPFDGIQLSGSYNTSSTNSRIRVGIAAIAQAWHEYDELLPYSYGMPWIAAMGDDAIEDFHSHSALYYERMGHSVKIARKFVIGQPFEFCSMLFHGSWKAEPKNWEKMIVNLFSGALEDRYFRFVQWKYEMRHHPRLQELSDMIIDVFTSDPLDPQQKFYRLNDKATVAY